jgi:hypothetical protein
VRVKTLALVLLCVAGCDDSPDGPPPWPALEGPTPGHGLETLELRAQQPGEEGARMSVLLRRDGCFRTERIEGSGESAKTIACTACSDDPAIEQVFADAKSREVVTVHSKMGKALAPPIRLADDYAGYLFLERADGGNRRGSSGDAVLERIARQLLEGVPGAPELGDDRCAEIDPAEAR